MNILLKSIIILLLAIVFGFIYGITVGGELSFIFLAVIFFITLLIAVFLFKGKIPRRITDYFTAATYAIIVVIIAFMSYYAVNESSGTVIAEYETTVISGYSHHYFENTIYFLDPQGIKRHADYYDWQIIQYDAISDGDTVKIREINGVFDCVYYVLVE